MQLHQITSQKLKPNCLSPSCLFKNANYVKAAYHGIESEKQHHPQKKINIGVRLVTNYLFQIHSESNFFYGTVIKRYWTPKTDQKTDTHKEVYCKFLICLGSTTKNYNWYVSHRICKLKSSLTKWSEGRVHFSYFTNNLYKSSHRL